MADINTLAEEAKTAARKHAPNARAIIVAIDTLAEAHQAEVSRLTREAENVRRKWLGHRDTGHLSLVEAADHVVGGLHADIDRLTRENEGLAADLVSIRSAWNTAEAELAAKQDAAPTSAITVPAGSESSGLLKLARYGAAMLHWHRGDNPSECGDVDAITCEEEAVRCGVLEGRNVDEPCCADCICAPFIGWEVCYFMPDDVRAARDKLSAARNPGACSVTDGEA